MSFNNLIYSQLQTQRFAKLYSCRDNESLIRRLCLNARLEVHSGCVNTISWSDESPNLILSGSDDQTLAITDAFLNQKKATIYTGHKTNIFCAKFMPHTSNEKVISCSSGGDMYLSNVNMPALVNNVTRYQCHGDKTAYEMRTLEAEPAVFLTCGQDGTCKWIDTRVHAHCHKAYCNDHTLLKLPTGITAMAVHPLVPFHIVCAGLDGLLRFFDRRMLTMGGTGGGGSDIADNQTLLSSIKNHSIHGLFASFSSTGEVTSSTPTNTLNSKRITSVQYDMYAEHVLASYQPDIIYLLDWRDLSEKQQNEVSQPSCSESKTTPEVASGGSSNTFGRKIRIHTDWSDTGPNSMPQNEMASSDPRTFLAQRLSDWFTNLAETRTRSRVGESGSATSPTETQATTPETLLESASNAEPLNSAINAESDSLEEAEPNSDEIFSDRGRGVDESAKTRANSLWFSNSLMSSKIKLKQAIKFENNALNSKPMPRVKMTFTGHRNSRTIIKESNFWGTKFVVSGSDCGHVFFWDKSTGRIVTILEADKHVVNCLQENPMYPVLASSGIDYDVKVWQPTLEEGVYSPEKIATVTQRNKIILEENRDTLFIPVQFMLPALRLFGGNMRGGRSAPTTNSRAANPNQDNNPA